MRILIVEDDPLLSDGISTGLKQSGYSVDCMHAGAHALSALATEHFDLMVLDLGLPDMDGLSVLQKVRDNPDIKNIPVLILTARDALDDRIRGLDSGADDYLVKPFDLDELNARLRALLRRSQGRGEPILSCGKLQVDPASHSVTYDGASIELSPKEYAVLLSLVNNPNRVVEKNRLAESIYSWQEEVESNALEVHVHHLRKKLDSSLIKTIRGVGYMLCCQQTSDSDQSS